METSVPRQRDPSESALVDMLMLEAPVGLALFGTDSRFRWVNAALTRFDGGGEADPSSYPGRRPADVWPPEIATRAEAALRQVLD
ncbi:MAG TPA: PAS domain-containing protein, partial [Streptosporangiaceae bacterium]|nr:PAS domain-containing protein [Streptosporangiaceae bacterium]